MATCRHSCIVTLVIDAQTHSRTSTTLSPTEQAYVDKLARTGTGADVSLHSVLLRLCPYFRGKHSSEEIAWREGVSVDTIAQLLRSYPKLLAASHRARAEER